MNNEDQLLQKLMISKKIMEKHNEMGRGNGGSMNMDRPVVEEYQPVNAKYNVPQEYLQESEQTQQPYLSQLPRENTKPVGSPTTDAIKNSRLPDEIKRLMMEHPIQQPTMGVNTSATLSNDLIERASRLMNTKPNGSLIENTTVKKQQPQNSSVNSINAEDIKSIVRETVQDVLRENGLLIESTSNSNELFKFKVGQHLFEGKITSVKKVAK